MAEQENPVGPFIQTEPISVVETCLDPNQANGDLSCKNNDTVNCGQDFIKSKIVTRINCNNMNTVNGGQNCIKTENANGGLTCNNTEIVNGGLNCNHSETINVGLNCNHSETINGGLKCNHSETINGGLNCNHSETIHGGLNCNKTENARDGLNCNNSEIICVGGDVMKSELFNFGINCTKDDLVKNSMNYEQTETVNGRVSCNDADHVSGGARYERSYLLDSGNQYREDKPINGGVTNRESDTVSENSENVSGKIHRRKVDQEHCSCRNANDSQVVDGNRKDLHVCKRKHPEELMSTFINEAIVPLILMISMPHFMLILWYTMAFCGGSYLQLVSVFTEKSPFDGMSNVLRFVNCPSPLIIWTLIVYCIYALVTMKLLPGKTVYGPVTPKGNTPVYKDNGFVFFLLTMALFWTLTVTLRPFGITPSIYYDKLDEIIVTLNLFSIIFCLVLYIKGKVAPSTSDSGSTGNIIFDYYWGMELYPRIFGFDVKVFTNCRFGLMIWALMVCIHAVKSYELHGFVDSVFVSALLQIIYLAKFYWWEAGYYSTIDIMVDRAGFYICWGCMVFVPVLYTSVTCYLVSHPVRLGLTLSAALILMGLLSIYANYEADAQKQNVRKTNGQCLIWGRKPDIIRAKYQLESGGVKESILLASGWWGVSRHFHYVPEIVQALLWSLPAMFENLLPYSYVIFLIILLTHRSLRDERKCSSKYREYWQQYCAKVPYRMVPYVF